MSNHHTLLGQLLKMFPRIDFQKAVFETKTEYHVHGFSSWNHFVAMLFGQLAGQDSLRGIEAGMATQARHLYILSFVMSDKQGNKKQVRGTQSPSLQLQNCYTLISHQNPAVYWIAPS